MTEILRTTDPTVVAFSTALLRGEHIDCFVLDVHMSVLEGGIGLFPRRLVVAPEQAFRARAILRDNGVDGVPVDRILELGAEDDPAVFNMAHMGLRMAQRRNGVAKLHGIVSREMFAELWPGFDPREVPISSVTNGVHAPTWVAREIFDRLVSAISGGQLGEGGRGITSLRVALRESPVAWASYEGAV